MGQIELNHSKKGRWFNISRVTSETVHSHKIQCKRKMLKIFLNNEILQIECSNVAKMSEGFGPLPNSPSSTPLTHCKTETPWRKRNINIWIYFVKIENVRFALNCENEHVKIVPRGMFRQRKHVSTKTGANLLCKLKLKPGASTDPFI